MRICFISHSSGTGGAEQVLLETIEAFQARGVECRVLLPDHGEICTELARLGIPFSIVSFPLWMSRGRSRSLLSCKTALGILFNTVVVAWKIYRWQCDIVYSNTVTVCVGALASRLMGRPHIWHLHEFGLEDQGLSFLFGDRISLALVNQLSSRCICVSHALANQYAGSIDRSKIDAIYPSMHRVAGDGADFAASRVPPKRRFRCVIVGSLMEGKGQEESLLAFAQLKKLRIDAELLVVGEGLAEYRRRLEELIRSEHLEDMVHLVGRVRNALPIMRSSNAVLVCSKSEAFGRVTIEGMFIGRPVIGARAGATAELILDNVNGVLYNVGDAKDLAQKIKYLYENPAAAEKLATNAKSWARSYFTIDRYGTQLMKLLSEVTTKTDAVIRSATACE